MDNSDGSVYSRALSGLAVAFPDLAFFTNAAQPLTINPPAEPASLIRLSIDASAAISLTGLQIGVVDTDGSPARAPRKARVRTSERPGEAVSMDLSKAPAPPYRPLVEVARTQGPWVVADLGGSYALSEIRLWSVAMPRQAWTPLRVEVSEDGEVWKTVYSTVDRLSAQVGLVSALGAHGAVAVHDPKGWAVFVEVLGLLIGGQRGQAEKRLRYSELPAHTIAEIRQAITRTMLDSMELDWNHHGIRRTFKYWTKREKVRYIKAANEFIDNLAKDLSPHVCLGFGSVLSLVREQDLIPHDDDLDIIIAFDRRECPTMTEGFRRLVDFAARHGYRVREPFPKSHRQFVRKGSRKVDVFVGLYEDDRISWYPQKRGDLAMADVFPPIRASMLGVECLVPANPLRYLESVYGPTWSKPDPFFSHNWRTRDYDDIW